MSLQNMLAWIDDQHDRMLETVRAWARISSWSLDPVGLARMREAVAADFASLGGLRRAAVAPWLALDSHGRETATPLGDALSLTRPEAARPDALRVLLAIHMDTVYPPYPAAAREPEVTLALERGRQILRGPGVTDAKGGLAVMLVALEAIERFGHGERLAWEVLVTADEELGSPGSAALLTAAAARHDVGLVFEPALDDAGTLAAARKGSGNFQVVVRGRAAHAGRRFAEGRNAVVAAAHLATALAALNDEAAAAGRDLTVNVAAVRGGTAFNVVPDLAIIDVNVRIATAADADWVAVRIAELVAAVGEREGITAALQGGFHCPPKPLDPPTRRLLDLATECGGRLGLTITSAATGGVCDGNKLAAAGLPTLDTLGVRGGSIHSPDEYLIVESLTERAKLAALMLAGLGAWTQDMPREAIPCS
jgi:glutamate carboxypeptidase